MDLAVTAPLAGLDSRTSVEVCAAARGWGYRAAWAAEVVEQECFALLGAIAARTDLDLGVAVVPVQTRSLFVTARAALTLAELTGGRFTLGIGASSEVIVSRFAGVPYERPLEWVREAITALRPILAGERGTAEGPRVRIGGYRWPLPVVGPVPIYLGSLNPGSLRLCGELADGLCVNQVAPAHIPRMLAEVAEGARAVGRTLPDPFPVVARLFCAVTDDPAAVREVVRNIFAPYAATAGYNRFFRWLGYEEEAEAIARAAAAGDRGAVVAAYSDRMVDELFVIGDADHVAGRIAAYVDAGVTLPIIAPLAPDRAAAEHTLRTIGAALGG